MKSARTMYLLRILQQAQARQRGEAAYQYINSPEGQAMAEELNRLRAACEAAEANYHANKAKRDAERAAEAKEFGDHRSAEEISAHYGEGRA